MLFHLLYLQNKTFIKQASYQGFQNIIFCLSVLLAVAHGEKIGEINTILLTNPTSYRFVYGPARAACGLHAPLL